MMFANRNHKQIKMTTRSHSMPPRKRGSKTKGNEEQEQKTEYAASLRAEVVASDETLQRLFALEIEKAGVVTQQGYKAVYAYFLQSPTVTNAVRKREDEMKRNVPHGRRQSRGRANPFRLGCSLVMPNNKQIVPFTGEPQEAEVNLALRSSVIFSEDEHEQLEKQRTMYQKEMEEKHLVDSFQVSYKSKTANTDCQIIPTAESSNGNSINKLIEVKEILVADGKFKRTNSSSSLELKEIFPEIESDDDDETSSTGSSYSSSYRSSFASEIESPDLRKTWLPWPKKNDGDNLLVSFPSIRGNESSAFLAWPEAAPSENEGSWERHRL